MKLPDHLGGHSNKTNIDEGALNWILKKFKPKTFLDIGCGPGGMVELAVSKNLDAFGIDGDFTLQRFDDSRFLIHDFSSGSVSMDRQFDIGWSCEFVEHVYEKFIPNYITSFQQCKIICMTYAPPGHGGYHHVNEQDEKYWIDTLLKYGFLFDQISTNEFRNSSTMHNGKKSKSFVKHRGLVFVNEI